MRKSYRDAILAEVKAARAIADTAVNEQRDLSDVERDTINTHLGKASDIETRGKQEDELAERMAGFTKGLNVGLDLLDNEPTPEPHTVDVRQRKSKGSVGSRFTKSDEWKALMASVPEGRFSEKARVHSQPMAFGGMKDLFYSSDRDESAGVLVENDRRGMLDPFWQRPLSVRQLFANGNTTSDTIEYVRWDTVTNNASVVPEATSADPINGTTVTNAIGGLKPQSAFTFTRDTTTVKTIAHWIPITKRALADAAQIRTYIDTFLRYGLEEAVEDEVLTGDGTGEHLLGLYNTPGVQTQAAPGAGETNFHVLRRARRKVQIGGRANPTAYVMNPIDWEDIELTTDGNNQFYAGGPFQMAQPRLWGLPVITSESVMPGTAWCAAWNWGVIYDREQANVQATDSHADFFVRNLVAILAELRVGFTILRPSAFCRVTLAP